MRSASGVRPHRPSVGITDVPMTLASPRMFPVSSPYERPPGDNRPGGPAACLRYRAMWGGSTMEARRPSTALPRTVTLEKSDRHDDAPCGGWSRGASAVSEALRDPVGNRAGRREDGAVVGLAGEGYELHRLPIPAEFLEQR